MRSGVLMLVGAVSICLVCVGCVATGETEDATDGTAASAMGWTSPPTTGLVSVVKDCFGPYPNDPTGIVADVCVDPFPNPPTGIVADEECLMRAKERR